ncbi:MAG: hypothetical protein JRG85_17680 [Deltaproteobacteria bacterium]|nr:hypothetical protein [Deltaproteobacteria bacterium]
MKLLYVALTTLLVVGLAGPAIAAKGSDLPAGGNTIAGPGTTAIAVGETVTVANTGKEPVRLDLIDAGATSVAVPVGATVTLCGQTDSVDLVCTGTKACSVGWRADKL